MDEGENRPSASRPRPFVRPSEKDCIKIREVERTRTRMEVEASSGGQLGS